jgi:hypothetical protein
MTPSWTITSASGRGGVEEAIEIEHGAARCADAEDIERMRRRGQRQTSTGALAIGAVGIRAATFRNAQRLNGRSRQFDSVAPLVASGAAGEGRSIEVLRYGET